MLHLGIYGADGLREASPISGCFKGSHHQNLEKNEQGICEEDMPEFSSLAEDCDYQKWLNN